MGFTCSAVPVLITRMQWAGASTEGKPVHSDLIGCQDAEGGDDLLRRVGVGCLSGHKVDEGLEGDSPLSVGIHQGHDAGKFGLTLWQGFKETFTSRAHNNRQSYSPTPP